MTGADFKFSNKNNNNDDDDERSDSSMIQRQQQHGGSFEETPDQFKTGFLMSKRERERKLGMCAHCKKEGKLPLPVERQESDICADCKRKMLGPATNTTNPIKEP